jgi:four helix bundle protein
MRDNTKIRTFGSLRELHYRLSLSKRLGFLRNEDLLIIEPKVTETEKVLNGLIKALRENWISFLTFSLRPSA